MTMLDEDKFAVLAEHYGLDTVLEQNDLTPEDVIRILHRAGLIDLDDYFYEDKEDVEED